jgi:NADH-quinone oxidoreductase subunit A
MPLTGRHGPVKNRTISLTRFHLCVNLAQIVTLSDWERTVFQDFLPVFVLIGISTALTFVVLVLSRLVGPFRPNRRKLMPYESGVDPIGPAVRRIPVKFYLVAVSFIVFDIEVIFFLPWAVVYRQMGLYALAVMAVFTVILLVGYVYEWRRGGLEWE